MFPSTHEYTFTVADCRGRSVDALADIETRIDFYITERGDFLVKRIWTPTLGGLTEIWPSADSALLVALGQEALERCSADEEWLDEATNKALAEARSIRGAA